MSIKKKLGLGVASAALGISLVGGGTWAAFNDTATINNHFAAGTLDLEVGKNHPSHKMNFDLGNMKPGDSVQRIFKLNNVGSIAIKEVLLDTTANNFLDGNNGALNGDNTAMMEYLSQFKINFASVDGESARHEPRNNVVASGADLTLADLVTGPTAYETKINSAYLATDGTKRINLAPLTVAAGSEGLRGIPVDPTRDSDAVFIEIEFIDNPAKDLTTNEYVQNKYQGDSAQFFFNLEATQWAGVEVDTNDPNGSVNNGIQGSADDTTTPTTQPANPSVGSPTPVHNGNEVVDGNNRD
ncbi:TasA family protein [Bacillus sp. Marseille-Q1617]|uniref:TasA family protein n=1 Tax=Bacillus sp. Marseille-Q1617 TaxID=2736887 RepID=UPI001589D4C0|nr:TasA family protein [Bacillus sp. Marseille-Q1617]